MKSSLLKIGGLILVLVVLGFLFFGGLGNDSPDQVAEQAALGDMYTALDLDSQGCPVQETTEFYPEETIVVGLDESRIPQGTRLFARLYHQGQPVEDAREIVADRDMDGCVWFEFSPDNYAGGFDPGQYTAEIYVNGNPANSVQFAVVGEAGAPLSDTGGLPAGDQFAMGGVYTTSEVDRDGCPLYDVAIFYPDELIYLSMGESFIPAGTEMFARLYYEGQPIEDTDPIYTAEDRQTCVWFEFEPGRGGWEPGRYEAELYVDGYLAENVPFEVQ